MLRSRSRRALVRTLQFTLTAILALFVVMPAYAAGDEERAAAPPEQGDAATKQDEPAKRIDADKLFGAIVKVSTHGAA